MIKIISNSGVNEYSISLFNLITNQYHEWVVIHPNFPSFELLFEKGNMFDHRCKISISLLFFTFILFLPVTTDSNSVIYRSKLGISIHNSRLWIYTLDYISAKCLNIPFVTKIDTYISYLLRLGVWCTTNKETEVDGNSDSLFNSIVNTNMIKYFNHSYKYENMDIHCRAFIIRKTKGVMCLTWCKLLNSHTYDVIIEYHNLTNNDIYNKYSIISQLTINNYELELDNIEGDINELMIENENYLELYNTIKEDYGR